ncbi:thiol-disulfide isomerase and thioredoxin [Streptococcus varani]|uniref:Thiol-disulfide isomerase and thioredoxin n=1 Tax=Streptococcus varani TaxID=1608583 RepID=A0A0E4CT48_9STRE|nr:thioredoxin family protein [Streptococcus varani]CQR25298.1 thiol-disulfide isomerase and thioredoxin [Streptococcus varani]
MKKIITFLCLMASTIFLVACTSQSKTTDEKNLTSYQSISLSEAVQKIQNQEDFYLYVGRPTCPYCVIFSPNLEKAITTTQVTVYYVDTDQEKQEDVKIFAQKENIQTTPNLSYYKAGKKMKYLVKGSESSVKEIEDFLTEE